MNEFQGKRVAVIGGTGSMGQQLVYRLLTDPSLKPEKVFVFSRDEAKHYKMRNELLLSHSRTDEITYNNFKNRVEFRIGDVRDYASVCSLLRDSDIVVNAAALKQVPVAEYFPVEAMKTNLVGAENIVRGITENNFPVRTVIGVSTDKACHPTNVMGMTKALQERIFIAANVTNPNVRFACVRYGNVAGSRGSVIPYFHEQIQRKRNLTVTHPEMTRFIITLDDAVDLVLKAVKRAGRGEVFIPRLPALQILDLAEVLAEANRVEIEMTRIRPGEKLHESLVSDEEVGFTRTEDDIVAIRPMLPELFDEIRVGNPLEFAYTSRTHLMSRSEIRDFLDRNKMLVGFEEEKIYSAYREASV